MRRLALLLAAATVGTLPAFAADDAAKAKQPNLDGVWDGWVVEGRGENANRGQIHLQLTIKDNQVTGKKLAGGPGPDDMGAGTVTITEGDVKQMDATRSGGGGPGGGPGGGGRGRGRGGPGAPGGVGGPGGGGGGGYKGILAIEGDTLKWCVANPGKDRPSEFSTDRRKGQFLLILKKQEPATNPR